MQIHSVESLAALDGEGLRYGLFLSGCPLRCVCCHNPDTWDKNAGKEISCQELLKKIIRYVPYFGDKGGVTFSGGEPLLQASEIAKLGSMLKEKRIGYAIDTSGCVKITEDVRNAVRNADMVICDLKFPDEESMKRYTGGRLAQVLDFLDFLKEINMRTWIRTVIIPDINDSTDMIDKYICVLKPYRNIIEKYELLGFHTMGFFKYEELGICNPLAGTSPLDNQKLQNLQAYVNKKFIN